MGSIKLKLSKLHETYYRVCEMISLTMADQNTGGALLEFPMRTAVHGKSRVSSAISVCDS